MASVLFTIGGAVVNALAFSGTNFIFSRLTDHDTEECKRHNRMERLDFINRRLREKNEATAYINNSDEAMLEYYRIFAKRIKPLPPEPQLSDFYHPSGDQKHGELLFAAVGTGLATYAL